MRVPESISTSQNQHRSRNSQQRGNDAKYDDLWKTEADAGRIRLWGKVEGANAALVAAALAKLEANKGHAKDPKK